MSAELTPEQRAKLDELLVELAGDRERAESRLRDWIAREEMREESEARGAADAELGEPSETEWRGYLSMYGNDRRLALQAWRMDRRPPGDGLAGYRPSIAAPIRQRPAGSR